MAFPRSLVGAVPLALVVPAPVQTAPPAKAAFTVSVTVAAPCRLAPENDSGGPGCAPILRRVAPVAAATAAPVMAKTGQATPNGAPAPTEGGVRTVLIRF
jgi:hypothetical protein